ncbi:MAG: UTP--glucose-1-phosphate uridylyltransferase [Gammaproteobacteria bacterium]|jgi:UTP--glucose-1-phosphate uridylyltransferase|nr:UTP--glucose-1-phosphate uridylyltransferase [Gammaproteobacteria bacterium]MBQ0774111.1 UTP--glucose-1-phosphate uridylyltransferase [Gammaproteobacteria bacterium]
MNVRKAILPVAGMGTRFLPATKAIPKELIPVIDKPVLQYVVEEAAAAGITEIVLVTHTSKPAIERHFAVDADLESDLRRRGKDELLALVEGICPAGVSFTFVLQDRVLGLGYAVSCAREVIGDEPFAVLLPDVLVDNRELGSDLATMIHRFQASGKSQVMVEEVDAQRVDQYGIVSLGASDHSLSEVSRVLAPSMSADMKAIVEKPSVGEVRSNLAVVGRYVFPASLFDYLASTSPGADGEIQLTDAVASLLQHSSVQAYRMEGVTYDCGSKVGCFQATLAFARRHPQFSAEFSALITQYQ